MKSISMLPGLPHPLMVASIVLLALFLPPPLYLISLALFGLPHVIWELCFLRSRYAKRWPKPWWIAIWSVLLPDAAIKVMTWRGIVPGEKSRIIDMLTLLVLLALVVFAPRGSSWLVRLAGACLATLMWILLDRGDIVTLLLILALLHNFTPLGLAWDMAREHGQARVLAWALCALFLLPLAVAISGWSPALLPRSSAPFLSLLDGQFPQGFADDNRPALWSAVVLAQCLHYYCVIALLPKMQERLVDGAVVPAAVKLLTGGMVIALLVYYIMDYAAARQLYAVAAGIHAWLEWPVLLMALLAQPHNRDGVYGTAKTKGPASLQALGKISGETQPR